MSKELLVDEEKINRDISEIDKQIALLTQRREIIIESKKYLVSIPSHNGANISKAKQPAKPKFIEKKGNKRSAESPGFILGVLKSGRMDTNALIAAWAKHVNKPNAEVGRYLSKVLARLKQIGKIDNEVDKRGKRYGSVWFLK